MHSRQVWFGFTLLALVACAHPSIMVSSYPPQDVAPIQARVDPSLLTLTERWATGGTSGEVRVGALIRRFVIDDPQAPLRLTYVTSQLHVTTVVSPVFYRPPAYQACYQLTVRVESPAIGVKHAWLQGIGEGRSLASAARATSDAIAQTVRAVYDRLAAVRDPIGPS